MSSAITKIATTIISWSLILLAFLLPLFFLPLTPDFYTFNKQALLFALTSIILLAWLVKMVSQKSVRLSITPFTLPLALFSAAFITSALLQSPNKLEAFLGRPGSFIALFLLYLAITSNLSAAKTIRQVLNALITSATLLSIIAIYQFLGLNSSLTSIDWLKDKTFTPAGSSLTLLTFLVPILLITLYQAFLVKKDPLEKIIHFLLSALMIVAIAATVSLILPGQPNALTLLPYSVGWDIAIDSFKSLRTALLGFGPENFIQAFSLYRPGRFNLTPLWNLRFTFSSNEPFHLLSTVGLFGLGAWILLLLTLWRTRPLRRTSLNLSLLIGIASALLIQLFLPANFLLLVIFYLLIILYAAQLKLSDHPKTHDLVLRLFAAQVIRPNTSFAQIRQTIQNAEVLPWIVGIPASLIIAAGWYFATVNIYPAEAYFKQSLDNLKANRGTDTYNLQITAIAKNPSIPRYHRTYATTNLALANTLAQKGQQLSTADRQNITQLIQQSIREAKLAAQLNPKDPQNWETLATIYRNLINVAQGADNWAIAAYAQAIQSDPLNPRLRLDLGGVYYAIGRYDEAIRAFQQTTELKPDWANAYYNLAAAYREKGDLKQALSSMNTVLKLVDKSSADYQKAQTEYQDLAQKAGNTPQPTPQPAQTQLETPPPTPSPQPGFSNITLPETASPPAFVAP